MARPEKDGVNYWNEDCDFYSDKKIRLLRSEFGGNGMYMLNYIFCEIYKNGYYEKFDKDWCSFVSDGAVCGGSPNFVEELVKGCVRRSVFDKRVFDAFGIITSKGIQKRYIRMVCERKSIRIIEEYFLLDLDDPIEVPEKIREKIIFKSISNTKNLINDTNNSVNRMKNTQSKVKESKGKESKVCVFEIPCKNGFFTIDKDYYNELTHTYPNMDINVSLKKLKAYLLSNPEKQRYKNAEKGQIDWWLSGDDEAGKYRKCSEHYGATYDISEYESTSVIDEEW